MDLALFLLTGRETTSVCIDTTTPLATLTCVPEALGTSALSFKIPTHHAFHPPFISSCSSATGSRMWRLHIVAQFVGVRRRDVQPIACGRDIAGFSKGYKPSAAGVGFSYSHRRRIGTYSTHPTLFTRQSHRSSWDESWGRKAKRTCKSIQCDSLTCYIAPVTADLRAVIASKMLTGRSRSPEIMTPLVLSSTRYTRKKQRDATLRAPGCATKTSTSY